jgi:hypothetical protein
MVEKIYKIKNQILEKIDSDIEKSGGIDRVNTAFLGQMVDMVKDLAEAEEKCWKAQYYRQVSEAMSSGGASGYMPEGARSGYGGTGSSAGYAPMGYNGMASSRQGYGTAGFGPDPLSQLKAKMQQANPQEKEHMVQELRSMLGM